MQKQSIKPAPIKFFDSNFLLRKLTQTPTQSNRDPQTDKTVLKNRINFFVKPKAEQRITTEMAKIKTIRNLVQKRTIKREQQMEKLQEKRLTQWEDDLLRMTISAIPRTTPKKIEETMEDMKKNSPSDYSAAEEALDAIGLFRENVNGAKSEIMGSEPYQLLLAETLSACARQTNTWKFLPVPMVHPFTMRLTIMTAATGKKIPKSELKMLEIQSKKMKNDIEQAYELVSQKLTDESTETDFINGLRELYPNVLPDPDESALNQCLASENVIVNDDFMIDYDNDVFLNSEGEPDGFVFDPEQLGPSGTESESYTTTKTGKTNTDNNDNNDNDDDDDDDDEDDNNEDEDAETAEMPTVQDLKLDDSFNNEDIQELDALVLPQPKVDPRLIPTKTDTETDDSDFTSSFSESILKGSAIMVNTNIPKYSATPPPPRQMGTYAMVPPIPEAQTSPKATVTPVMTPAGTPNTASTPKKQLKKQKQKKKKSPQNGSKRLASPLAQPPKLTKVEKDEGEIRQLRHDLELSNRKMASMHRIIQSLQQNQQQQQAHERFINQWNSERQRQHQQQLTQFCHQQITGVRHRQLSPVHQSLGPRTSTNERTNQLINCEPLSGRLPPNQQQQQQQLQLPQSEPASPRPQQPARGRGRGRGTTRARRRSYRSHHTYTSGHPDF